MVLISHIGFTLLYNEIHEQAGWVAYQLTREKTNNRFRRTNKFLPDPTIRTGSAVDKDYAGSGYDRGHLAPAADMGWSLRSITESFYYSNMSPQLPAFNRGVWKRLEEQVRFWATESGTLYIVTGPVLKTGLPFIGTNQVSVPEQFYKVVLDLSSPDSKGSGFILAHAGSNEPLSSFAVSIDRVEELTGIDFFPSLPDADEEKIENDVCIPCWSWKGMKPITKNIDQAGSVSVRCSGTTLSGKRCRLTTRNLSGRCYQHDGR